MHTPKGFFLLLAATLGLIACGSGALLPPPPPPLPTVGEIYQLVLDSPGTDTDGDGIPDDVELHPTLLTDPDRDDTDADGVFDAFEVFGRSLLFVVTQGTAGELYPDDRILDGNGDNVPSVLDVLETGEEFMVDSDGDGVYNYLEYYGYRYDWPAGKFVKWTAADRQAHPEVPWYRTDPLQPSTDQDAYSDGMEVSGLKMDVAVDEPGRHPLVAAYPNIVVTLKGYTLTLNEQVTYEDGGSINKGTSWSRETKSESSVSQSHEVEIGVEGGFEGGFVLRPHAQYTWGQQSTNTTGTAVTTGSTVNEEINWNRARCYNPTEAARIKLLLKVENIGTAPVSNFVPTINLCIGGSNVATFRQAGFEINMLMPGGTYPEAEGIYWVVDTTESGPLTLTAWELKALENGAPVNIAVTQMSADVMKLDDEGAWQAAGDIAEYVARCKAVSANLFAETGPGKFLHRMVYADQGPTAPAVTLRDALRWSMGATEQGQDIYIAYEDKSGAVEQAKLTNQAGEGWSIHMDQSTRDGLEPGQQPLDLRLHRDSHIELVAPRDAEDLAPTIYTAYVVPLDDGWEVITCTSDYEGIKEVVFVDRFGEETKMLPDGRGPWFYSARIPGDYELTNYGLETVRVTSLDPDAMVAERSVEVIHTVVSKPPAIGRLLYNAQNRRLQAKVERDGDLPEDELAWVRLYHPSFLAAQTKELRNGYITMIETVNWFEDPDVYECELPHGWVAGMRLVAASKGGLYSAADVKDIPTIHPHGYGSGTSYTKVAMYWPTGPGQWNVPQHDLDPAGRGYPYMWVMTGSDITTFYYSYQSPPNALYDRADDWPQAPELELRANFAAGDVHFRSAGDYYHWNSYMIGLQNAGLKADPAAAGKAGEAYYLELTAENAAVLSAQFVEGGEFAVHENAVFVFRTSDGRLGKLFVRRIHRERQNALLPNWFRARFEFNYVVFRKVGDGLPPAIMTYDTLSASYSRGTAITPNAPQFTGPGDPPDGYVVTPSLPSGLELGTRSGIISGTPTATAVASDYTITASNTKGFREETIRIEVLDPPSGLSYVGAPFVCATGDVLPDKAPTVDGEVDEYTISPALPDGLTIDAGTGVIRGTPTKVTAKTDYTVTASNHAGGSTTGVVNIETPLGAPKDLSYQLTSAIYTVGTAIVPNAPTVTNPVTSYTISPALPSNLTIHAVSGVISGTPQSTTSAITYTITATNTAGSTNTTIVIEIN